MLSRGVQKPFFHHFLGFLEIAFCRGRRPDKTRLDKVRQGSPRFDKASITCRQQDASIPGFPVGTLGMLGPRCRPVGDALSSLSDHGWPWPAMANHGQPLLGMARKNGLCVVGRFTYLAALRTWPLYVPGRFTYLATLRQRPVPNQ